MRKMLNKVTLIAGSATKPSVELYQLESGRCRLYWYSQEYIKQAREMFAPV